LSDFNDIDASLTELKDMQQILRDKFTKKSKDLDEDDYNSKHIDRKIDLIKIFTFDKCLINISCQYFYTLTFNINDIFL